MDCQHLINLLMGELALLVYGIVIISNDRCSWGSRYEVLGSHARTIGLVYMSAFPVMVILAIVFSKYFVYSPSSPYLFKPLPKPYVLANIAIALSSLIGGTFLTIKWKTPRAQEEKEIKTAQIVEPPAESDNPYSPPSYY